MVRKWSPINRPSAPLPAIESRERRGRSWLSACKAAGVPGRIFHDLRQTAVRNLERAGVPRSVAMKMVRHKTEPVYRRYAIASDADLREAAVKLAVVSELSKAPTGIMTNSVNGGGCSLSTT
jgi:integrase